MKFNIIDMERYERREHFHHYANNNSCSFSLTANIDVTKLVEDLKEHGYRMYPTFIYIVSI